MHDLFNAYWIDDAFCGSRTLIENGIGCDDQFIDKISDGFGYIFSSHANAIAAGSLANLCQCMCRGTQSPTPLSTHAPEPSISISFTIELSNCEMLFFGCKEIVIHKEIV